MHCCSYEYLKVSTVGHPDLTLLEPQSRFGDKPLKLQVFCPVLKGLIRVVKKYGKYSPKALVANVVHPDIVGAVPAEKRLSQLPVSLVYSRGRYAHTSGTACYFLLDDLGPSRQRGVVYDPPTCR